MNMKVLVLFGIVVLSTALPVTKNEKKAEEKDQPKPDESHHIKYDEGYGADDPRNKPDVSRSFGFAEAAVPNSTPCPSFQLQLEYNKYLQEVVSALENDPEFRAKLDKADEADIRVRL